VSGSQPFPQAAERQNEKKTKDAGDPLGSKKALAQTNATAKDMAALAAAMQRMQQYHVSSMAVLHTQLQTQFADQLRDHQAWWRSTAKDQAAARTLVRTHLMELAEANANILAANTALDKVASSALQSHLLVQNLENKLSRRVERELTKNAALFIATNTRATEKEEMNPSPCAEKETCNRADSRQARKANNANHRTLRMKTPKDTCAFMPGCNDPRSVVADNRRELPEGQACACYRPVDRSSGERVDCSSLIDKVTSQALQTKHRSYSSRAKKGKQRAFQWEGQQCGSSARSADAGGYPA
jgi:hypothetical protein